MKLHMVFGHYNDREVMITKKNCDDMDKLEEAFQSSLLRYGVSEGEDIEDYFQQLYAWSKEASLTEMQHVKFLTLVHFLVCKEMLGDDQITFIYKTSKVRFEYKSNRTIH